MKKQSARTQIASKKAEREAKKAYEASGEFMSSTNTAVDLRAAKSTKHTAEELRSIERYANERNVKIFQPQNFDGDTEVLKEQIDVISEMKREYGHSRKLTIAFAKLDSQDLAATSSNGKSITFNIYALRDRALTDAYLTSDNMLSSSAVRGIGAHEMGHVLQDAFGNKGLDIARKAYYHIYGVSVSKTDILSYLGKNISDYAIVRDERYEGMPIKDKHFKEVIPEVMGKNATNPNEFTVEFIRLLKEGWNI